MLYREIKFRRVDRHTGGDSTENLLFNLYRAALAAADETMQGSPFYSAWLQLFQTHLSSKTSKLRWCEDLAESTEMRRAYSAMYGRYFSRGLLTQKLGITDFVPLNRTNTNIGNVVTVNRKSKGDIPDWIAWDSINGSYVLVEAKGNLTGKESEYLYSKPPCIEIGKAQLKRVDVKDLHGKRISTHNWVAANLWSTEVRGNLPVSLLWKSINQGSALMNDEIQMHASAIREHRTDRIGTQLTRTESFRLGQGISSLVLRISIEPSVEHRTIESEDQSRFEAVSFPSFEHIEELSTERHEDVYIAALITPLGVRPILDKSDLEFALSVQRRVKEGIEVAMIYGLSMDTVMRSDYKRTAWLSGGGIATTDGAGLFNLKEVQISEA